MEMRVLLAFALSALVLLIFAPRPSKTPPPKTQPAKPPVSQAAVVVPKPAPAPLPISGVLQDVKESETTVENDLYLVRFSNHGGVVKSWVLKRYNDAKGEPLDLVRQDALAQVGAPFSVWTAEAEVREKLDSALFVVRASSPRAPATLTMEFSDGALSARKEFRFEHGTYVVQVRSEVAKAGAPVPHDLIWRGGFGDQTVSQAHMSNHLIFAHRGIRGEPDRKTYKDVKPDEPVPGSFSYLGIEDLFFAAVFMPGADSAPGTESPALTAARGFKDDFKPAENRDAIPLVGIGVGEAGVNSFRAYVGPKDLDILKTVSPDPQAEERLRRGEQVLTLSDLVHFGWFSVIALPLFLALKWIYHHVVPNYGWAIILSTVVINFALFPLKLKSMKSAMKMQKLAPQIKAIQEKYKKYKLNDPRRQEQNKEVMDLYRKHGINPLSGCLPMVLQIPFLYAFYKVLSLSIEMRHAPWVLWIRDLSVPEPHWFKVLPILMIGTMVVLQKMTPQTSTDPVQQRMFTFMPLMFGVMFYNVSSGLVLYWLVGNIVQIGQQWYINRTELRPAPREE